MIDRVLLINRVRITQSQKYVENGWSTKEVVKNDLGRPQVIETMLVLRHRSHGDILLKAVQLHIGSPEVD